MIKISGNSNFLLFFQISTKSWSQRVTWMLPPNLTSHHQDWDLDLIWPDHQSAVEVTFNTFLTHLNHFQDLKSTNETENHKAVDSGNKNTAEAAQRPENTNDDEKWPTQHTRLVTHTFTAGPLAVSPNSSLIWRQYDQQRGKVEFWAAVLLQQLFQCWMFVYFMMFWKKKTHLILTEWT